MIKTIFIATVAALSITAPAQAMKDRPDRGQSQAKVKGGGEQRAKVERPQRQQRVKAERPQRAKTEHPQRKERARAERPQRQERVRAERPQRVRAERPQRQERVRAERPQRQERVRAERPKRQERVGAEHPRRQEPVRAERPKRQERVRAERPQRQERVRAERVQRQNRIKTAERKIERRAMERARAQRNERVLRQQAQPQRMVRQERAFDTRRATGDSWRNEKLAQRLDRQAAKRQQQSQRRQARAERRLAQRAFVRQQHLLQQPSVSLGSRYDRRKAQSRDWYDDYSAKRFQTFYRAAPGYHYDYDDDDGYLYQIDPRSYAVTNAFPLLGGAFSVGRPLPIGYQSYNVPSGYRDLYFDTPQSNYRYGAGAIYRVDPTTQLLQTIVALVTGQRFGIGQMLPAGYDVYNVPYSYRDRYFDTSEAWYRYDDGSIYQVDPYTRRIVGAVPVSYGMDYMVGSPVPAYASYGGYGAYAGYPGYSVPYGYQQLYYGAPGYNYHYASGGIYQVDPTTQLVTALVALLTGTNLGVGQMLPAGYDVYNVPDAYRDQYFDTSDAWYRYDDGYIYDVDPRTRMIRTAIPVSYDGYAVGYPVPAAHPGYAVPGYYDDLYYASPDYDYRYFDNGIYAIDPETQRVEALAALVTGQHLAVGQVLPAGYDAYNLPYDYRDDYYDSDDYLYRYADGRIYQVDPQTRLIQTIIDAIA